MPKAIPVTREQALERARSVLGAECGYRLGAGGRDPAKPHPWDAERMCDCSGFIAWCLGLDRYVDEIPWYAQLNGGWLETSAIVRDCSSPFGIFARKDFAQGQPGDLLVYGDREGRQGHVGLILKRSRDGYDFDVAHCSKGNLVRSAGRSAILTGSSGLWRVQGGIVAAYAGFAALEEPVA